MTPYYVKYAQPTETPTPLRYMPRNTAKRIRSKILACRRTRLLAIEEIKKLSGRDAWRLRIGDWRALYTIDTDDPIRKATPAELRKLARALGVQVEDLRDPPPREPRFGGVLFDRLRP